MKLSSLNPGEKFQIPHLSSTLRNLVVLRSSDCSILVNGEFRNDEDSDFIRGNNYLAPSTEVLFHGEKLEISQNSEGKMVLKRDEENKDDENKKSFHEKVSSTFRGVGRKVKNLVEFPKEEFSIQSLAEKYNLPYHTISNAFNREKQNFTLVRVEKTGKRGKGKFIFIKK